MGVKHHVKFSTMSLKISKEETWHTLTAVRLWRTLTAKFQQTCELSWSDWKSLINSPFKKVKMVSDSTNNYDVKINFHK